MNYRELQQELKKLRNEGNFQLQGFKLNQKAIILQTMYTDIINEARQDLDQPKYDLSDLFPSKSPVVTNKVTIKEIKATIYKTLGAQVTNAQLREAFGMITFFLNADHKDHVLNFTKVESWKVILNNLPKVKANYIKMTAPAKHEQTLFELVKNQFKFQAEMNLKTSA